MIVILCGKSASGKDTLLNRLADEGYERIVSTTSRPMRDGEKEGKDYFFITRDEFESRLADGKFIEHRSYNTFVNKVPNVWYYGVEKRNLDLDKDYVTVLDLKGAENFKNAYPNADIFICYIDVPDEIRTTRAENRGSFDRSEWDRRLIDDNIKFSPDNVSAICDCTLINDHDMNYLVAKIQEKIADFISERTNDYEK